MAEFVPCKTIPSNMYPWWIRIQNGGNSPCILGNPPYQTGCTLSNCVGWAWGRYCQIRGSADPLLPTGNAGQWWRQAQINGKNTGSEPALGAVICFDGHVAIVEEIAADGSFINCSESDWGGAAFIYRTRYRSQNWSFTGYSPFQGFIYQDDQPTPGPGPGPEPEPPDPDPQPTNQRFRWIWYRKQLMNRLGRYTF